MTCKLLGQVNFPRYTLNTCDTFSCTHWSHINNYYNSLVRALKHAASCNIPFVKENTFKHFWSAELSDLKQASVEAHAMWRLCGKPVSGPAFHIMHDSKYKYKLALRHAMRTEELEIDDQITELYLLKDANHFWRKWQSKFPKRKISPNNINSYITDREIAGVFKESFSDVYFDSYADTVLYADSLECMHEAINNELYDNNVFDVLDIEKGIQMLKNGRASGFDGLSKEHIIYSHPAIIVHLKLLFNMMYLHGFVPDEFGKGVTIPIPKDRLGDITNAENYRPITISPVISKIFEYCILHRFNEQLQSSNLQFGFKQNSSCSHAIFLMKQVTDYFVNNSSSVYVASLDARKAFDRVNHVKLFKLLLEKGVSGRLVKVIHDWYSKTSIVVKWNEYSSEPMTVKSGIRQGGVLSPVLFNMYVDVLINALTRSDLGYHLGGLYIGCILYADDIILLSASVCDLQRMLNICYEIGKTIDVLFNAAKSALLIVGKACKEKIGILKLGEHDLMWVDKFKYLGLWLCSDIKINIDISVITRKTYAAANAIFHQTKYVSDIVKLSLIESYVLPILTYAIEAIWLTPVQVQELSVCVNNMYRRIFGMNRWESVKLVQFFCGRLDFCRLYHLRKLCFLSKILAGKHLLLNECFFYYVFILSRVRVCYVNMISHVIILLPVSSNV